MLLQSGPHSDLPVQATVPLHQEAARSHGDRWPLPTHHAAAPRDDSTGVIHSSITSFIHMDNICSLESPPLKTKRALPDNDMWPKQVGSSFACYIEPCQIEGNFKGIFNREGRVPWSSCFGDSTDNLSTQEHLLITDVLLFVSLQHPLFFFSSTWRIYFLCPVIWTRHTVIPSSFGQDSHI